ncbi:hypothetical protein C8R47DRAFT_1224651 [Mycena vitilis]|nr:hypothetical protein C8R47DRAFT_1224651 [Mycena vitilis]
MKKCPQPVKCFGCGQEGHLHKNCPTSPLKPRPKVKKPAALNSEPAAAVADATLAA